MFFKYNKNSATKRNFRNFVVFAVVMLFATVFLSLFPEQVYAARKTKTLVITDLYPGASITPHYVNDYTKDDIAATTINYGNSGTLTLPSGWGSIKVTFSGNTATVTLTNVDVYKKTPYLYINAGNRTGYKASGWKTITDSGDDGLNEDIHPNPPKPNEWTDNTCDFYMGANFTADKMQVLWASNQYNLTLDYNGATTIPSSTTVYNNYLTYDGKIANVYDASRIAKTGYSFDGWYCGDVKLWNADGTPVKGAKVNGSAWSDSNGNYKWVGNTGVKAKWIPIKYHVQYNGNGGTVPNDIDRYGTTVKAGSTTYMHANSTSGYDVLWKYDSASGNTLNTNQFTRTGYIFVGWNTKEDGSGTSYGQNAEGVKNLTTKNNGTAVLYAQWSPVSVKVTYHKNDGGSSTASQTFTYGVTKQQFGKKTDGSPLWGTEKEDGFGGWDRPGYHILGWSESSTATKATYGTYSEVADSWIASKSPSIDIYAVWSPKEYSISYDLQGGSFANGYDNTYVNANGYAYWRNPTSMPCRDSDKNKPTGLTAAHGDNNYFDVENPTRTGYIFAGWKITGMDSSEHIYWNDGEQKTTVTSANTKTDWGNAHFFKQLRATSGTVTFEAQWTVNTYTATFNPNGGVFTDGITTNKTVSYKITDKLSAPESPTRTGYTFSGWKVTTNKGNWTLNNVYPNNNLANTTGYYGNVTFTAQWSASTYTATFTTNGGNFSDNTSNKALSYTVEQTLKAPESPTRTGYTFSGWKVTENEGNWVLNNVYPNNNLANTTGYYGNVTFTAQWSANVYTVTFNGNKPSAAINPVTNVLSTLTMTYDSSAYWDLSDYKPTLRGWVFLGWYDAASGGNLVYDCNGKAVTDTGYWTIKNGSPVWQKLSNITVYAHWKQTSYSITFDGNKPSNAISDVSLEKTTVSVIFDNTQNNSIGDIVSLSGYTFLGWYDAASGGAMVYDATGKSINNTAYWSSSGTWNYTGSIKVYAHWSSQGINANNTALWIEDSNRDVVAMATTETEGSTNWINNGKIYFKSQYLSTGIYSMYIDNLIDSQIINNHSNEIVTIGGYEPKEGTVTYTGVAIDGENNSLATKSLIVKYDKTKPVINKFIVSLGSYEQPLSGQQLFNNNGTINSLAYGANIEISISDKNSNATSESDVSGIKYAYIVVKDKYNASKTKSYVVIANNSDEKEFSSSYTKVDYGFGANNIININKDFQNSTELEYELHVIDNAGNENIATTTTTRDIYISTTIERTTENANTGALSSIQFKGGYRGVIHVVTTGWVDTVTFDWPEEILKARLMDIQNKQPFMDYNVTIDVNPLTNVKVVSEDDDGSLFTRCYDFEFWIPIYIDEANNMTETDRLALTVKSIATRDQDLQTIVKEVFADLIVNGSNITADIRSSLLKK